MKNLTETLVKIKIDGIEREVPSNSSVLEAAKAAGIQIPTLCYHEDLEPTGNCGVCLVQVKGQKGLKRSCTTPVYEGMEIITHNKEILDTRKGVLELILANHPDDCLQCIKNSKCELRQLADKLGVEKSTYEKVLKHKPIDDSSLSIVREPDKCILCGRCTQVCQQVQTVFALETINRGFDTVVSVASGEIGNSVCVNCGQCISVCPVGALYEVSEEEKVWAALEDPDKIVIVQEAPAVRVSLAEEYGLPAGTNMANKMYTALKMLGFDHVFDTNFSADLTIMEEGSELLERLSKNENLPLITSCSPGWIKFLETFFHDLLENVSSCKSPQQMFGALAKTYFAKEYNIDPSKIVSVSIMPCTAKKFEAKRPEMKDSGYTDVDHVITTREFIRMLKKAGIDLREIPDGKAEDLMGQYSGAATIFGATGGVMEAALRTAYELATGKKLDIVDFEPCIGLEGIKELSVNINGTEIRGAVAHGLGNARELLNKVVEAKKKGEIAYHFIEIMACPGGCVGGGGQPYGSTLKRRLERACGLYMEDKNLPIRKSHENPAIKKIYEDFLGKPLSHKSHELLHTEYVKRDAHI